MLYLEEKTLTNERMLNRVYTHRIQKSILEIKDEVSGGHKEHGYKECETPLTCDSYDDSSNYRKYQ